MAKDYNIPRTPGQCRRCERQMTPGEEYLARVIETDELLERIDYCDQCADEPEADIPGRLLGSWRATIAEPREKKKLFIDDELLLNFFERLDGADEPAKINFRFVLTLVLMRKRLLVYERSDRDDAGGEVWTMRVRGCDRTSKVIDPHLDEDKIAEVSLQLNEILEGSP